MATVRGVVRADNRSPVPGAVIVVGGKRVTADAEGVFLVGDVPLGRQILMVTAPGFMPGRVAMDLASGETEKVTIVLRRVVGSPLDVPRSP
jgi:Carboxypeptidase regulatory-like domain